MTTSKIQVLWDYFIHSEPHSYEKSTFLDAFLAELLVQVHDGSDLTDILSFCSIGSGGISTLVACELLSDVHELCAMRTDGGELRQLRKYLVQGRGWRSLAVLHLLGVRGLSCGRELVALLVALYPVALQEAVEPPAHNPYVRFHSNDDTVDTVDIIAHTKKKPRRNRSARTDDARKRRLSVASSRAATRSRQKHEKSAQSTESELFTDGIDQARSLTLKIRLNPMDFEYFTCVVRSDEERDWKRREGPRPAPEIVDDRLKDVLQRSISNFEISLLILQLLQSMRDYDTPAEQSPAVQVLKFALDTLWALQFGADAESLSGTEGATLKAAAARLMLTALERVLRADEPTTAVIHNGLLPMTLRLLEDACSKPVPVLKPEEGSLVQEFIFATTYAVITFLYCLLHQRGTTEKLGDFLELFQLFTESQDGKLIERTILTIVRLPSIDPLRSMTRARKVIDMIGALISALKRVRQELLANMSQCDKLSKFSTHSRPHHHSDILGVAYSQPTVGSISKQSCCIASLFVVLIALLKESQVFDDELKIRLVRVITAAGTCCCFSPKILLSNVVSFILAHRHCVTVYVPSVALLERCLFKELGVAVETSCKTCSKPANYNWEFLQLYKGLLTADCPANLCYVITAHLLRVTPSCGFHVRREMLLGVFYPTFLRAKRSFKSCSTAGTAVEFIIQSCLSVILSLVVNGTLCDKFIELNGLDECLELLPNPIFTRSICSLLEVAVIIEMCGAKANNHQIDDNCPAFKVMFEILERETKELLRILDNFQVIQLEEEHKTENLVIPRENGGKMAAENSNEIAKKEGIKTTNFLQASAAWRAAAGVALCSPKFRVYLAKSPLSDDLLQLFKLLANAIATDCIVDVNKSAHRLFEALITCCLTSPLCERNVIQDLTQTLINAGTQLGRGIAVLVDALLRVAMIKPSPEQTILQPIRPRLPTMSSDSPPDCGGEDSSAGEYVTADDGYEADNENQGPQNNLPKRQNSLGPVIEPRGHANAHPALCSLAIDLLIHFAEKGLDGERGAIVSSGLRKVAVTCRESATSCAALAGSGAITRLLNGFQAVLSTNDPQHRDLQHAVLEVFTLLATQSISPSELVSYLSLFKSPVPPLLALLQPLFRLVMSSRPQPNFILAFPTATQTSVYSSTSANDQRSRNLEKAESLVNNFRKKHLSSSICSPWSMHAACLPVGPESAWSAWLHGCAASMWIRVERGSLLAGRGTLTAPSLFDSDSESLSEWGVLSDNWSKEVVAGSATPPTPAAIIHLVSIGFESLVLETWLDLRSDKLILRLTRPDEKINRTISETSVSGILPSGRWHHLALNIKDKVLNKRSAVVEVVIWLDGWREVNVQLPFDGLLVRKPSTTCVLLGQVGPSVNGAWYLGNFMLFRCPIFTKERALYLASLGPNYTNLADCILSSVRPDFAPLIASGALHGVREIKFEGGKFDESRRKSYGGTYFRHVVETKVSDTQINWDAVMDATTAYLCELQDNILLCYEAQSPNIVNLYPQAITNPGAVVRNLFPGQPGFRAISAPEHRVSQQPPMSLGVIAPARLERQQYMGLVPALSSVGGVPIFLFLFARVVELDSSEEEQALALSVVLHLARSDSELQSQYRAEGSPSLILRVLESPRCHAGKHILKAVLDATCDSSILVRDVASDSHSVLQNSEAVVTDPELVREALGAWRVWAKFDTLNLFLQALLLLLRDQHSQREFNAAQFNRVNLVDTILLLCKEHFLYEDGVVLDAATGGALVELIRALMGAPPEFPHLVAIADYLVLVHQACDTYVTHSRHNMYFLLRPVAEDRVAQLKTKSASSLASSSDESGSTIEMSKLNKARVNVQIQRERLRRRERRTGGQSRETSAGEDSGIAASDGSNHHQQSNDKFTTWTDAKRACQGLVCEGLLVLLRDAIRVLPDSQVASILKHVVRVELLIVLLNNPDPRVRAAVVKVIQAYLQRTSDEEVNKFIKNKYFWHLANQLSLYSGSEQLLLTLESLAARGPTLAAMPPLLATLIRSSATDPSIARPILTFITDVIAKHSGALRVLMEQGLAESLAQTLVGAAHRGNSTSLLNDIHILLVGLTTKLLESPGSNQMQAISDLHSILNHVELNERSKCGANASCVSAIRTAQVVVFDGELDTLMSKVSTRSGFKLRSTASYLASASYLTTILSTSSDASDHESRTSSYGTSLTSAATAREPARGEINERFRAMLFRAVEFVMSADQAPACNELQLTRRLFSTLLHGLSSPLDRKSGWSSSWSSRPLLRKKAAKMMVWLLGPQQSNNTRVFCVRSLMEEPRGREILSSLLEVAPQIEQKFTVFFWDLMQRREEMPSADARVCSELREALSIWQLVKNIEHATPGLWSEELALLRREMSRDRDDWLESNLPAIQRVGGRFEPLAKQLSDSAMTITQTVIEEQNRERKVFMAQLKHTRAMEAQAVTRWRELTRRLTHECAPWHFAESYPTSWELDPTEGPARIRIRMQRCHLKIDRRFLQSEHQQKLEAAAVEEPLAFLFTTPRQDVNATALIERLHTSERIRKMSQARVVTPRAELQGEALIGETCLYFVPDNPDTTLHTDIALGGLDLAMAGGTAWRLEDIREIHQRRYQLQERAIEIFLTTGRTYLLAFNSSRERDEFTGQLSTCNLPQRVPGDDLGDALAAWRSGNLTNWEYITCLNKLAGRSYNDLMQYPVFPFVLADYISDKIDLNNSKIYRNFERPMAVQDKKNEQHYINNYNYFKQALAEGQNLVALNQEPFHYGSHYSNSGTVLHFLVRLPPFTSMFLCYQDNNFDIPDRTFHALATTWRLTSCDSTTDVKELIPEFYYLPEFLLNTEGFNFGVRQNGARVGDVELPAWCNRDARLFVLAHRAALEADIVREKLPYWIDLVFGFRQTGRPAVEAINVFHPATYYGFNVDEIADPLVRQAWETMIKTYGQTPAQLFTEAHPLAIYTPQNPAALVTIPPVIEGVAGIKWGQYVGAPGNEPVLCWKHKHRTATAQLVPLATGDVFGLPPGAALLLGYSREKGTNMLSSTSVLAAALASWSPGNDGIVRLKCKKEAPPKPLIHSPGLDSITLLASTPDCGQLWLGHLSGRITVYGFNVEPSGRIHFNCGPASVLLAHRSRIRAVALSRAFSVAVSGDDNGVIVVWDLNSLSYVRSIECRQTITNLVVSETLGDIAVTCQLDDEEFEHRSELRVFTVNARPVGSVLSRRKITALAYSNAPEGVSVNVIATGLDNGVIRLWSSWDLRLVREIVNAGKDCGAVVAIAWALDQHHLYAATQDSTVLIWEGMKRLSNGTPKFVNLTTL